MVRANVIATSGRAVEAAGDVDVLLLDKTGTITLGDRQATRVPSGAAHRCARARRRRAARVARRRDARGPLDRRAREAAVSTARPRRLDRLPHTFHKFSAHTRMSGVDLEGRRLRKGAADAIRAFVEAEGGVVAARPSARRSTRSRAPARRRSWSPRRNGARVLGVIELRDIVKGGIRERFAELREMGIKTIMVTGDNRLTAAAIAAEAGVDEFLAEATPEDEARADPQAPERGPARRDVRRRHERRAGARAGRRRGRDEHGHAGRERGRQHGRPRLQSDQADRGRRRRQADARDARRAHDVLGRERRRRSTSRSSRPRSRRLIRRSMRSTSCGSRARRARSCRR